MRAEWVQWDGRDAPGLAARLRSLAPPLSEVSGEVERIVERVREGGDAAVRDISASLGEEPPESIRRRSRGDRGCPGLLEPDVREALGSPLRTSTPWPVRSSRRGRDRRGRASQGQAVEVRDEPIAAVGVYAPGGRAAYPSSVLMCAIPARVAGVGRVAVATPPGPRVVRAQRCSRPARSPGCARCTPWAAPRRSRRWRSDRGDRGVDLIAGPGNRYVQEAKRLLSSAVGIDGIAGPSELMVVADGTAIPSGSRSTSARRGSTARTAP